jgi:hypothetical protein
MSTVGAKTVDDVERLRQLEARLGDLKARMPAHTVPSAMLMELEELEDEIDDLKARVREGGKADAKGSA